MAEEIAIGKVEKFFGKINVAAIMITSGELKVGDKIKIKGHSTDFEQTVDSMQVEHESVPTAGPGTDVGIKVKDRVHEHDTVFLVKE
jgi:translation elongation factor EF-1alpha